MRTPTPAQRARAVLAVTAIGMSTVVFSLSGVAQATTPTWQTTGTGDQAPIPPGICAVEWIVQGGSGGGVAGGLGGLLEVTTVVEAGETFVLYEGLGGTPAADDQGGAGGASASPSAADAGAEGADADVDADAGTHGTGSGGGGAASVVYRDGDGAGDGETPAPFLSAFGGDGAPGATIDESTIPGGLGGGGDANVAVGPTLTTVAPAETAGAASNGSITGTGVACEVPSAPADLTATPGDGQLTVSFTAPVDDAGTADVTGYEYSTDGTEWTAFTPTDDDGVLSTVIGDLENGAPYTVRIHATSAAGLGAEATVTETPEAAVVAVPAAPALGQIRPGDGSLTVPFVPVDDVDRPAATGWEYSVDEGGSWFPLTTTDEGQYLEGVIGDLDNGTTYHVTVRGVASADGVLEGDAANWVPAMPQGAPAAPTDTMVGSGNGYVSISFKPGVDTGAAMADVTGWQISTDGGLNFADAPVAQPEPGVYVATRTGLTNGQMYSLVLRATSQYGFGLPSAVLSGMPMAPVLLPPISTPTTPGPVSLTYVMSLDRAIAIGISPTTLPNAAPATSYQYRLNGGVWTTLPTTTDQGGQHLATITGLTNGQLYSLEIRGVAGANHGPATTPLTAMPHYALPEPGNVAAAVLPGALKVTWSAPSETTGLTGYEVRVLPTTANRHSADLADQEIVCSAEATDTSCVLPVPTGVAYDVIVMAIGADGYGDPGYVESAVVPAVQKPAVVPTQDDGDISRADGSPLSAVVPGQKVTLRGTGFLPGATIELLVYSTPISVGTAVAGPDGTFLVEVTLPADLGVGTHHLVATGVDANGNVRNLVIEVQVTASGATTVTQAQVADEEGLAYTGADVAVPAIGGLAALAIGGGLVVVGRRRRTAE